MIRDNYLKREIFEIIFYIFVGGMVLLLTIFGGFSLRGFEESFSKGALDLFSYLGSWLIYTPLMILSLLVIIYPIAHLLLIRKEEHPSTQEKPNWFRIFTVSYIFNPEDGALWQIANSLGEKKNIMRWITSIPRVLIISILSFGFYGIIQVLNPQLFISSAPQTAQQLTTTSDIIFGSAVPSFVENGALLFLFLFLLGIDAYFCAKFIKDKKMAIIIFFVIGFLIICPLMGLAWMSFHSLVYGNSEASLIATFIFGWLGSTITLLTGIFIFWFIWHFLNNLFFKLVELITFKEDIILISIIVWAILLITYISIEVFFYKKRKQEQLIPA